MRVQRVKVIKKAQDLGQGTQLLASETRKLEQLSAFMADYDFNAIAPEDCINVAQLRNRALFVGVIYSAAEQQKLKVERVQKLHVQLKLQYLNEQKKSEIYSEHYSEKRAESARQSEDRADQQTQDLVRFI